MANSLSRKQKFSPVTKSKNSTVPSLFQQLKPAIWVLLDSGIKVIILTLGSKGVLLCCKGSFYFQRICAKRNNRSHDIGNKLRENISQLCPSDRFFGALRLEERSNMNPHVVHLPAVQCASVVRLTGAGDCLVGGAVASICAGLDVMQSVAVGIAAAKGAVEVETNVPSDYNLDQIAGML